MIFFDSGSQVLIALYAFLHISDDFGQKIDRPHIIIVLRGLVRLDLLFFLVHQFLIEQLSPVHRPYNLFLSFPENNFLNMIMAHLTTILETSQLILEYLLILNLL
jgi:hypothetical protein